MSGGVVDALSAMVVVMSVTFIGLFAFGVFYNCVGPTVRPALATPEGESQEPSTQWSIVQQPSGTPALARTLHPCPIV